MITLKELICFFTGHTDNDMDETIPYGYCPRCEHDYNDWIRTLRNTFYHYRYKVIWWWRENIYWKCEECKKVKCVMGKKVNNHDECFHFKMWSGKPLNF